MPRYSYVIVFPVLVALCIGINIQRYPAVSAMLKGETVESRWLGRSDIFNFNTNKAEAATYQGYHSEADTVADSRASREPIPLSDSRSTSASASSSAERSSTDRSVGATRSNYTSRYSSSYGSDSTPTSSNSSTNAASSGTSNDSSSSYFGGGSYGSGSYDRSPNSSSTYGSTSDSYGDTGYDYDYGYGSDYGGSSYGTGSSRSTTMSSGTSASSSSSSSPKNRYNSYDDEDEDETVEEEQDSWSNRYGSAAETSFQTDTPQPGYSSRYAAGDNATTTVSSAETSTAETLPAAISNAASQIVSVIADANTESSEHLKAKTLSVQEKHDLRLLTPFSMTQSGTKVAGSDAYIPPDFLPRNADETSNRLQTPSATTAVSISPVTFGTTTETISTSETTETTSTPDEDDDTDSESPEDEATETTTDGLM